MYVLHIHFYETGACIIVLKPAVNVQIFMVTIFRALNFRVDEFLWVEEPSVITVANFSCAQILVCLRFLCCWPTKISPEIFCVYGTTLNDCEIN